MNSTERFHNACRSLPVDRPPIWLMRQAGRYMPEYQAVRARHSLLEICRTPTLAAEVTITAAERLGVDAAIIFADLLLPADPLGLTLEFTSGEGPRITPPLRTAEQIAALPATWPGALGFVSDAIARVVAHFHGAMPVIGFAGAPFTLASYLIEGGSSRHFAETKLLMHTQPDAWHALMEKLTSGLAGYLAEQAAAGAAALQLFDSWVGALSEPDYRQFVLPYNQRLAAGIQSLGIPAIYFSTGTSGYLETVAEVGAQVLSLDWRITLADAFQRLRKLPRPMPALQGNLDPVLLIAGGAALRDAVDQQLRAMAGKNGYIFNLGHGILPETPVENVLAVIAQVRQLPTANMGSAKK
ncbi:MAG TPA: uroporphyrinogen decarboxylase [Terriglobales bacterium]|nr:uroporphyrinogen decarboxylase [Terriglobales bacterium]